MKNIFNTIVHEKYIIYFFISEICFFILIPIFRLYLHNPIMPYFLVTLVCLCILSFYLLYKSFQSLSKQARINAEKEVLIRQKEIQNEHILSSMQAAKDFDKIKEQLIEIIKEKNIENETDYREYADQLIKQYAEELFINYCPNKVVDAILYNKVLIMKKLHITHSVTAAIPEQLPIENFAIMSILNNMIDNAIEACQMTGFKKRNISIQLFIKANYLVCRIENTINPNKKIVMTPGVSTKIDASSHGLGLQIIHQVCREHNGDYQHEISKENATITCTATIQLEKE